MGKKEKNLTLEKKVSVMEKNTVPKLDLGFGSRLPKAGFGRTHTNLIEW